MPRTRVHICKNSKISVSTPNNHTHFMLLRQEKLKKQENCRNKFAVIWKSDKKALPLHRKTKYIINTQNLRKNALEF